MEKVTLFWFRRDLRIQDNCGLYHALKGENRVIPIFIFDKEILKKLPKQGVGSPLLNSRQYIKNIGRKLRVESMEVSTLEGTLTAADNQAFTLEWKQREAKPVGKGKVTVTKQKTLSYDQISIAKVLVK